MLRREAASPPEYNTLNRPNNTMRWIKYAVLSLFLLGVSPAFAVEPDEVLDDPVLESRARKISANLRCVVCQNQSIDNSGATIAKDLRIIVRERLVAGDNDDQVYGYITDRYGDFVLLNPPLKLQTLILWFGPLFLLLGGGWAVFRYFRNISKTPTDAHAGGLSREEEDRLKALLEEGEGA